MNKSRFLVTGFFIVENKMNTLKKLLELGRAELAQCGSESPKLDAEVLLDSVLHCGRIAFYTHPDRPVEKQDADEYLKRIRRRAALEPVAYITGEKEFMGLSFQVTPDVLIPRPDTESVVEAVLESIVPRLKKASEPFRVLDLCTGSGAIGLSLRSVLPGAQVTLSDISPAALAVAERNALALGFGDVRLAEGDLFSAVTADPPYDLIISNPPYIPDNVIPTLQRDIVDYEPKLALSGGASGYTIYERIAAEAGPYLRKGGMIVLEVGNGQDTRVSELLEAHGFQDVLRIPDLTGAVRGVAAQKQ